MNLMPNGDYYSWYCDWCDSKNLTLWTKLDKGEFCCSACQRAYSVEPGEAIHSDGFADLLLQAV